MVEGVMAMMDVMLEVWARSPSLFFLQRYVLHFIFSVKTSKLPDYINIKKHLVSQAGLGVSANTFLLLFMLLLDCRRKRLTPPPTCLSLGHPPHGDTCHHGAPNADRQVWDKEFPKWFPCKALVYLNWIDLVTSFIYCKGVCWKWLRIPTNPIEPLILDTKHILIYVFRQEEGVVFRYFCF